MLHPWKITVPALFVVLLAAAPAQTAECDCTKLPDLQIELRNALRLQAAFRNQNAALRGQSLEVSRVAFQQFANGAAQRGLESVQGGGGGPAHVDYVGYGEGVAVENLDSPSYPGQTRQERQDKLCAMRPPASPSSMRRFGPQPATVSARRCGRMKRGTSRCAAASATAPIPPCTASIAQPRRRKLMARRSTCSVARSSESSSGFTRASW